MVGRATFAACGWIIDHYEGITNFYLESNFATDKKASQINIMRTRGKRVTAEATVKRDVLIQHMRVEPEKLFYHYGVASIGGFLSGEFPPGKHDSNAMLRVTANMVRAHAAAYHTIHQMQPQARVGTSINYRALTPAKSWSPLDRWAASTQARLFNMLQFGKPLRN